jgi:hypothetical protein
MALVGSVCLDTKPRPSLAVADPGALSAVPHIVVHPRICSRELVAPLAVRLPQTATPRVLSAGNGIEMFRADAVLDLADMVEITALRDRPDQKRVGIAVGHHVLGGNGAVVTATLDLEHPVAALDGAPSPEPAVIGFGHHRPEAFLRRPLGQQVQSSLLVHAVVVSCAQTAPRYVLGAPINDAQAIGAGLCQNMCAAQRWTQTYGERRAPWRRARYIQGGVLPEQRVVHVAQTGAKHVTVAVRDRASHGPTVALVGGARRWH